jgi:MipA family protein
MTRHPGQATLAARLFACLSAAAVWTTSAGSSRLASPRLNLDIVDIAGLPGWDLGLLDGPMYGSERNHDYFYSVAPQYATADRPAYDAEVGYTGSQFLMAVSKRYPKYWVGAFARWDSLKGAAFADSPLVEREYSFSAGIAVAWILGESSTRVEAFE